MKGLKKQALLGLRVLVVEDEYLLADDLRRDLEAAGARVIGPVGSVHAALALVEQGELPDLAILDVNLGGETVFPVAERLRRHGVPFIFATGFDASALPLDYAEVPHVEKPVDPSRLLRGLVG